MLAITKNQNQCDGCKLGLPIEQGIHVHPHKQGWNRFHMVCTAKEYKHNMLTTIKNLMDKYNVPRKVAVLAYRYFRGIDSVADVAMNTPKMGHWIMFCQVVECEGCNPPKGYDFALKKITRDGKIMVFVA